MRPIKTHIPDKCTCYLEYIKVFWVLNFSYNSTDTTQFVWVEKITPNIEKINSN